MIVVNRIDYLIRRLYVEYRIIIGNDISLGILCVMVYEQKLCNKIDKIWEEYG